MTKENLDTLKGVVKNITFRNEETGYTVAKIICEGSGKISAATGSLKRLEKGETVILKGYWADDPKYGRQFRFTSYESVIPSSTEGIKRFLASSYVEGVGEKYAEMIIDKFGEKTKEILDNNPEKLAEIPRLPKKLIPKISKAWKDNIAVRDTMIFLQTFDISEAYAVKICKVYGAETVDVTRNNPYRFIRDIPGIGFIKADAIANKIGIAKDSSERIQAGIIYILDDFADKGNIYVPLEPLVEAVSSKLDVDADKTTAALEILKKYDRIVLEDMRVYKSEHYRYETELSQRIKLLCSSKSHRPIPEQGKIESMINEIEKDMAITFANLQKEALRKVTSTNMMVVTGGPGTGKTTLIKGLIGIFKLLKETVILCAPTGRAAKRMTEATGVEAKTIHRLLEFNPQNGKFTKNEGDPIAANAVILDEASMVDTLLMTEFMRSITPYTKLVMVGDVDQLPSIGPGNVLKDIITSGTVPTVRLDEIFRQASSSRIVTNAHRIKNGKMPFLEIENDGNFFFIRLKTAIEAANIITEIVTERLPRKYGFDPLKDIQIISPMHKGDVGVEKLNRILQESLNKDSTGKEEIRFGNNVFRSGDKVMQIKNNYDNMVFNGDIGIVERVSKKDSKVYVKFDNLVEYAGTSLEEIVPAYAISVHKSQGSEFRCVVMPVTTQHFIMLKRNLLYTAITRARELVVIVGDIKALSIAVNSENVSERFTTLSERLKS